jgi:hypothetical protein
MATDLRNAPIGSFRDFLTNIEIGHSNVKSQHTAICRSLSASISPDFVRVRTSMENTY